MLITLSLVYNNGSLFLKLKGNSVGSLFNSVNIFNNYFLFFFYDKNFFFFAFSLFFYFLINYETMRWRKHFYLNRKNYIDTKK